ncbi:MAG: hypothetical protein ACE5H2_09075, partial [Terriglobia bacterium]
GYGGWFSFHPEGPLWFRGFALWPQEVGAARVANLLANLGATHFVVGHTAPIRDGRIHTRFGGKVFLIDTGMLASHYLGGQPSVLEIQNGKFTAIYPEERTVLLDRAAASVPSQEELKVTAAVPGGEPASELKEPPALEPPASSAQVWLDPDGKPLPFTSDAEVLEFLRTARVVRMRELGRGITRPYRVLLEKDGLRMHAIFHDVNQEKSVVTLQRTGTQIGFRDTYKFQVAGYELGRLLGLDSVPPAIERKIRGKRGSLAAWVENTFDRRAMKERKISPPNPLRWNQQIYIMWIFDRLIENTDRTLENVLIDQNWKVWMIDHTRAFRRSPDVKTPEAIVQCERNLWEKLRTLDEEVVKQQLKKYLRSSEIKALLKRREKLVNHIQKLIEERGEAGVLYTLK